MQGNLPCALRPNNLRMVYVDETFLCQKPSQLLESLEKAKRLGSRWMKEERIETSPTPRQPLPNHLCIT